MSPGDLETAVTAALEACDLAPRDLGAAELARLLAAEIDQAERAEHFAERALEQIAPEDEELNALIRVLRSKAGHRDAVVRCGQRLESLLRELGATPSGRARAGAPVISAGGPLSLLRGGAG